MLSILKSGLVKWNKWRKKSKEIIPDLTNADLPCTNLKGAYLIAGYLLPGVNLIGANLHLNLIGVNLRDVNMRGANLSLADLSQADLRGADLSLADLRGANLSQADLRGANLSQADLRGANLSLADLRDANLSLANFSQADLRGANLSQADLHGANLSLANLHGANLIGARLSLTDLAGTDLDQPRFLLDYYKKLKLDTTVNEMVNYRDEGSPLQATWTDTSEHYHINFDGIYPCPFQSNTWQELLVYIYFEYALDKVLDDFERRKQSLLGTYSGTTAARQYQIPRDSLLTIIPEIPSVVCNPPSLQFRMTEDYHCLQFRVMHQPTPLVENLGRGRIYGAICIYLETLLIGEITVDSGWEIPNAMPLMSTSLVSTIAPQFGADENKEGFKRQTAQQFRKIFASYSHKDIPIVKRLEKAYRVLGDDYWRDFQKLRSGENWSDAIEQAINECNVFQLCWSSNAKTSEYVNIEWRAALKRKLEGLIRPIYWEKPLPEPPRELSHLHFAYYPSEE